MAEEYAELIQQEIDGANSEVEQARLREYLKTNPDAEQLHADLKQLNAILAGVEDVPLPDGLRQRLLQFVPRPQPAQSSSRQAGSGRVILRYGYALAAGLVLGVGLHAWMADRGSAVRLPDVSGTMAPSASESPVLEEFSIAEASLRGAVHVRRWEAGFSVVLDLDSTEKVDVALAYEGEALAVSGLAVAEGEFLPLAARTGRLEWTHEGQDEYTVQLRSSSEDAATIRLEFSENGRRITDRVLRLPAGG
jgi:hypothetical protein